MNSSIRMETDEPTSKAVGEEEEEDSMGGAAPAVVSNPAAAVTGGGGSYTGKPTCFMTSKRSEWCEAKGDIRVNGNASTIYINPMDKEWKTKPYARYHDPVAMAYVHEFTLKPFGSGGDVSPPACTKNHSVPAFLFSNGGFSGNLYHDYIDVLVPLFISTHQWSASAAHTRGTLPRMTHDGDEECVEWLDSREGKSKTERNVLRGKNDFSYGYNGKNG